MSVFRFLVGATVLWLLFAGHVLGAILIAIWLGVLIAVRPDPYANRRRITYTRRAPWWW